MSEKTIEVHTVPNSFQLHVPLYSAISIKTLIIFKTSDTNV